ncbi:NADAR family protein (plasmid) [Azospirillum sp. HJ39]|uniref:NADAR family protein n=1 Tax=Azospirillum sp. HJ39 TaxID=3159496 RepID=UPI0035583294
MAHPPITSFHGQYRFLSNFEPARISVGGIAYPTVEHAYQAMKTLDVAERRKIALLSSPGSAKKAGKWLPMRPDWDGVKIPVMTFLVMEKFWSHQHFAEALLATGDAELVEGNTWGDTFWGRCRGVGENHLGKILMHVRDQLIGMRCAQ